jgi:hypothetical protein
MSNIIFHLNDTEQKAYDEFIENLPKKHQSKTRKLIFKMTGIGVGVTVKVGKLKKDITDYSTW